MPELLSELVCAKCGRTGHVTWEQTGDTKQVVEFSENLNMHLGPPTTFSCVDCGTPIAF